MVGAVDDRHAHGRMAQCVGRVCTAKAAADDHDVRAPIIDLVYLWHMSLSHTSNSLLAS